MEHRWQYHHALAQLDPVQDNNRICRYLDLAGYEFPWDWPFSAPFVSPALPPCWTEPGSFTTGPKNAATTAESAH
jgi:hypothetical protein